MNVYRKLERCWRHNDLEYIPNFKEVFPELKRVSSEELCNRFVELNIDFYTEIKTPVKPYIRITLPFAIILLLLMLLWLPFRFMALGTWGYELKKKNIILNWFKQVGIQ